jgi:hypothetical protein
MAGLRSTAPPGAAAYASVLTEWAAPDSTGTKIAIREGAPFQWSNYPTLPKVYVNGIYGWQRIVADLTGLDVSKSYRVHLTWWDCDQRGRVESVYLGDQLAMKNVALPRKPGDVFADLPRSSSVKLTVVRESGVNAVLNEIWIEEVH